MRIRDLMTPKPVTVRAETAVEKIAKLLLDHRINGVPVIDNAGRLIGIVTAEDLIYKGADELLEPRKSIWKENFWISFLSPKGFRSEKANGYTAAQVMTIKVRSVEPDMHPSIAAKIMLDYHLTALPVVEDGKVIGIISRSDILRHLKEFKDSPLRKD